MQLNLATPPMPMPPSSANQASSPWIKADIHYNNAKTLVETGSPRDAAQLKSAIGETNAAMDTLKAVLDGPTKPDFFSQRNASASIESATAGVKLLEDSVAMLDTLSTGAEVHYPDSAFSNNAAGALRELHQARAALMWE